MGHFDRFGVLNLGIYAVVKGRVLCRAATPHCVESNTLLEDSQLYVDMMAAVSAGETFEIIVTAQSVKEDGQRKTEKDRQTE